ncbi:MAG: hypothetical protein JRE27_08870 [Deltaproteobacteria bacterium]|nr:hypothetical protein [Deltaproteobacteria bacterium]
MKSSNFLIEHQCPQCGAPAILNETDRLFTCEYCRVRSYLIPTDFFRYVLPNIAPKNKNLIFLPYWRFKGMLFSCLPGGIKSRFVDVSHRAVDSRYFPISVGLRSQALKLKFVSPETEGRFLYPGQSFENVIDISTNRFNQSLPGPILYQSYIGETRSLIYSPFYVDDRLYDAVLNRPVASARGDDVDLERYPGGRPDWRIRFIPTLCPICGWDLSGERDALVLNCMNCDSVWQPSKYHFERLNFAHIPGSGENIMYMPFWRIKAEISEINLDSYADLVKVANLPKAVQDGWENVHFYFWSLAFKIRPRTFFGLARNMTLSQPRNTLVTQLPKGRLYPVTMPITEAAESLKIILSGFIKPQKLLLSRLPKITIKPESFMLVYIPFNEKHHEFVHRELKLAINKNQLALAGNL